MERTGPQRSGFYSVLPMLKDGYFWGETPMYDDPPYQRLDGNP